MAIGHGAVAGSHSHAVGVFGGTGRQDLPQPGDGSVGAGRRHQTAALRRGQ
ncbi:hypothetical protein GS584_08500 [Rhodococcus hoagii]|nr:hypothetical protein [Prescottella equi]